MNAAVEEILKQAAEYGGPLVVGYVGAALRWRKRLAKAEETIHARYRVAEEKLESKYRNTVAAMEQRVDAVEEKLEKRFAQLRVDLGQGLHLELETIRQHVAGEVAHLRERLNDLREMAEDLRTKSGDYTEEAELATFMGKVSEWMARTNQAVGRLEGMLGAASKAVTSRPPPPVPNSAPRPRFR